MRSDAPVTWAKHSGQIAEEALTRDVSAVLKAAPELENMEVPLHDCLAAQVNDISWG